MTNKLGIKTVSTCSEVPKASKRKLENKQDDNKGVKRQKPNEPKEVRIVGLEPAKIQLPKNTSKASDAPGIDNPASNTTNVLISVSNAQVTKIEFEINEVVKAKQISKASDALTIDNVLTSGSDVQLAEIEFKINEVVWAKIRGYAHWPARIKAFSNKMVIVVWFNDYRTTKMYRSQLFKFLNNFDEFAKKFDSVVGLEKAAKEALIFFGTMLQR